MNYKLLAINREIRKQKGPVFYDSELLQNTSVRFYHFHVSKLLANNYWFTILN